MCPLRPLIWPLLVVSALTFLSAGCGKQTAKVDSTEAKAFDSAPPEIKEAWDQALAADAATNYVETVKLLKSLRSMPLSEPQFVALEKETADFNQRLFGAAGKHDPAAVQAVQVMRSSR